MLLPATQPCSHLATNGFKFGLLAVSISVTQHPNSQVDHVHVQMCADAGRIAWIYDPGSTEYQMQVFDLSLLDQTPRGASQALPQNAETWSQLPPDIADKTFRELQGMALQCTGGHQVANRCLEWKARMSVIVAASRPWGGGQNVKVPATASQDAKQKLDDFFISYMPLHMPGQPLPAAVSP